MFFPSHSYDLQIADFQILISKQDVRGARSEYFPKLGFNAGTEYTKNFRDTKDTQHDMSQINGSNSILDIIAVVNSYLWFAI